MSVQPDAGPWHHRPRGAVRGGVLRSTRLLRTDAGDVDVRSRCLEQISDACDQPASIGRDGARGDRRANAWRSTSTSRQVRSSSRPHSCLHNVDVDADSASECGLPTTGRAWTDRHGVHRKGSWLGSRSVATVRRCSVAERLPPARASSAWRCSLLSSPRRRVATTTTMRRRRGLPQRPPRL